MVVMVVKLIQEQLQIIVIIIGLVVLLTVVIQLTMIVMVTVMVMILMMVVRFKMQVLVLLEQYLELMKDVLVLLINLLLKQVHLWNIFLV